MRAEALSLELEKFNFRPLLDTILYFRITYKNVVIKKKETQRLALYQGSPKEKKYKIIQGHYTKTSTKNIKKYSEKQISIINKYKMAIQ